MPYARPWSVSDAPKVNASLVRVKFRAKNKLGALVINEWVFAFKNGSVIDAFSLEDRDEIGLGTYRRFYPPGFFPGE